MGKGRASRNHMDIRFLSSARQRIARTRGVGRQRFIGQARPLPAHGSQALILQNFTILRHVNQNQPTRAPRGIRTRTS